MSLFEIDEALDLSIESATEHAAEGEISDELRTALSEHLDAFGDKVPRIANYIRAQEAVAEAAKKEACRLENRRKAAENRVKACKSFLCWFMSCRCLKHLNGRLNTITRADNSAETLILEETEAVPQSFRNVVVSCPRTRWEDFLSYVPEGPLLKDLQRASQVSDIDRARISNALKAGQIVPGARLVRGQHIRLR